eukprot:CAMPEP_0171498046 /NCGR_PEP_ID=MMETSP0958-20121227/7623_1 /TAXON_ID=87120 /ORGANISM="Aurantiochytrium limacinum, Strain ATCCMYA-1381" /LENGTH=90 /DNA_ID=CAMNT_0012032383 /DNA_START=188 /DNA_END=461 /DNA_ORIENTATION=+
MNGWMDGCLGLAGFGGKRLRGVRSLRRHFELEGEAAAAADLKVEEVLKSDMRNARVARDGGTPKTAEKKKLEHENEMRELAVQPGRSEQD